MKIIQLKQVSHEGITLKFRTPCLVRTYEEDNYVVMEIPDTEIVVVEKSYALAHKALNEMLVWLYKIYALEIDEALSRRAQELKKWLIERLKGG